MSKKILFITNNMFGGGAERVISHFANALIDLGHEVGIIIYFQDVREYAVNQKVKKIYLNSLPSKSKIVNKVSRIKQIKKIVQEFQPDFCVPFLDRMLIETYYAVRRLNIPIVATVRNNPTQNISKLNKFLRNRIYKKCSALFLQTEDQKQFFSEKLLLKSFVIPNPIGSNFLEMGNTRTHADAIRKIVTCGRLSKQKNHKLLIGAICRVHAIIPDIELFIYGEGEEKQELLNYITELNANDYINLCGRTNDVANVLNNADLFVLSSDYEGLPNSLMEAMAANVPCISTNCPTGPMMLLGNNERGLLVEVNNETALSDAVLYAINNVSEMNSMSEKAHKYMMKFSPDVLAKELLSRCCNL